MPDVVLFDTQTPDLFHLDNFRKLKTALPTVPFMVLVPAAEPVLVVQFIALGASGYLLSPAAPEALARAIKDVVERRVALCLEAQLALVAHLRGQAVIDASMVLSWQERKVMLLLSEQLSTKAIAAKLGISTPSVHSHLAHIYKKLGVHSRVDAVHAFTGLG